VDVLIVSGGFDEYIIVCIIASSYQCVWRVWELLWHSSHIHCGHFSLKPMKNWWTVYGHFEDIKSY